MEVGQIASALSQQLVIEDIDESDKENPQLCSEYVKEIYDYMRKLEVCKLCSFVYSLVLVYSIVPFTTTNNSLYLST